MKDSISVQEAKEPATPNPAVAQLERDVTYYKQLVKDLKAKLRSTPRENAAASVTGHDSMSGGVLTPVRKSKRDLRPITAEEAFHRSGSVVNSSVP